MSPTRPAPSVEAPPSPGRDRFVSLCGTCNTRDLGGLSLERGGETRHGRLYRADAPLLATADDLAALRRLGITTVLDLRERHEIEREPNALSRAPGITVHHVDVWRLVHAGRTGSYDTWDLAGIYLAAIDHAGPAFARALDLLADAEGAALFHCTVGKDRTGLLAALLLEGVGVARPGVIADYALTHDRIDAIRTRLLEQGEARGVRRADYERVLGATPDVVAAALDHVDARFGGVAPYLRHAGVAPTTLHRLEARLTR